MGKVHVEAILNALKQTVESLTVDGICSRNKIIAKSVDEQYVQDLEDGYSDNIQDIIDNIPDVPPTPPGPTLPTVQNVQCWFNQNQGSASVPTSFTRLVYDANNNRIPYSASLLYCVFLLDATETLDGTFEVVRSTNDNLAISRSNGTNSTTVYTVFYASCSDKTATIIDVYDSQNKALKAFKYTLDGVDYYRVMEWQNTHPDWTDDLSSIGYSLTPQNPNAYFTTQGSSASSDFTFRGGTITPVYDAAGNAIPYDSSKTYTKVEVYNYAGQVVSDSLTNGLKFQDKSGYLVAVRNWATYDQTTQIYRVEYTVT